MITAGIALAALIMFGSYARIMLNIRRDCRCTYCAAALDAQQ